MTLACVHCQSPVTEDEAVPAGNLDASAHPDCQTAVQEMWQDDDQAERRAFLQAIRNIDEIAKGKR